MKKYYKLAEDGRVQSGVTPFQGATELDIDELEVGFLRQTDGGLVLDKAAVNNHIETLVNKVKRTSYLNAYRKYQAAVNYGEFERVYAVDEFAGRLRNKDWAAMSNVPPQLRYFAGEVGISESGLIRRY
jgi:hypothetical protein